MLDTGEHAVGCAALSRFELAELQRLQLPVIVVVPSDALAATLDESAEGLELHLPLHLRPHLAGQPCVRFGDPRRLSQQLSELVRLGRGAFSVGPGPLGLTRRLVVPRPPSAPEHGREHPNALTAWHQPIRGGGGEKHPLPSAPLRHPGQPEPLR